MSESHCMDCGSRWGTLHRADCATHERDREPSLWPGERMDAIGQNGNEGDHYPKQARYQDAAGEDWIDEFARTATADEFRGAMRFTIGKYNRRMGRKDALVSEILKIEDYARRWVEYERKFGGGQ